MKSSRSYYLGNTLHDVECHKHDIEAAEDVAFVFPVIVVLTDNGEGHVDHVDDDDGDHGQVEGLVHGHPVQVSHYPRLRCRDSSLTNQTQHKPFLKSIKRECESVFGFLWSFLSYLDLNITKSTELYL